MKRKKPLNKVRKKEIFVPPIAKWVNLKDLLEFLTHPDFYWGSHEQFLDLKYLELRVDTRDLHCIVKDRNGKMVDLDKMKALLPDVCINEMNENKQILC